MSDYLWDKGGDADSEVERLERALRVFAQTAPPPPLQLQPVPRARDGVPPPLRLRRDLAEALRATAGKLARCRVGECGQGLVRERAELEWKGRGRWIRFCGLVFVAWASFWFLDNGLGHGFLSRSWMCSQR